MHRVQKCTEIANVSRYASLLFVFKLQSQFAWKAIHLASPVMSISAAENAFCLSVCLCGLQQVTICLPLYGSGCRGNQKLFNQ